MLYLFFFILLSTILIYIPVEWKIELKMVFDEENPVMQVWLAVWIFKRKIYSKNLLDRKKKKKDTQKRMDIEHYKKIFRKLNLSVEIYRSNIWDIRKIKKYFKKKIIIKELNLFVRSGTGDAMYTGIVSGIVWAAAGVAISYLVNSFNDMKKNVKIISDFDKNVLNIHICCIFKAKIVNIIAIGFKFLFIFYKEKSKIKKIIGGDKNG